MFSREQRFIGMSVQYGHVHITSQMTAQTIQGTLVVKDGKNCISYGSSPGGAEDLTLLTVGKYHTMFLNLNY